MARLYQFSLSDGTHLQHTHQLSVVPAATCGPEYLRKCGVAAASQQHPVFLRHHVSRGVGLHVVVQFSWPPTLKLFQAAFPPVERLRGTQDESPIP